MRLNWVGKRSRKVRRIGDIRYPAFVESTDYQVVKLIYSKAQKPEWREDVDLVRDKNAAFFPIKKAESVIGNDAINAFQPGDLP